MRFRWIRGAMRRMRVERGEAAPPILLRRASTPPEVTLLLRAGLVALLIGAVFVVFLLDRAGLRDHADGHVSVSDVFYFTMVTVTTVGYGDIVPVSDQARLIDAFFVTPVRMFIWLIFLGTAYQLVLQRFVEEWRMLRLQRELKGHVIICGYGHSGSIAANELLLRGWDAERVVVIDPDREEVAKAAERKTMVGNISGTPMGTWLTLKTGSSATSPSYQVDLSNAKISEKGKTLKRYQLADGWKVRVKGAMRGTAFAADTVEVLQRMAPKKP